VARKFDIASARPSKPVRAIVGIMSSNLASERHVAELRQTLRDLVAEAEKRVSNLEEELKAAKLVLGRMRQAVVDADKPF
jgi:hypothetical protein